MLPCRFDEGRVAERGIFGEPLRFLIVLSIIIRGWVRFSGQLTHHTLGFLPALRLLSVSRHPSVRRKTGGRASSEGGGGGEAEARGRGGRGSTEKKTREQGRAGQQPADREARRATAALQRAAGVVEERAREGECVQCCRLRCLKRYNIRSILYCRLFSL